MHVKQPPFITNKLSAIVLISEMYLIYEDNPTVSYVKFVPKQLLDLVLCMLYVLHILRKETT